MDDLIREGEITRHIYTLRAQEIMLDTHLAELYNVVPRRLREQVKRNSERFPNDFMFQINEEEVKLMVSQNAIPSKQHLGGALPYVFTEQGLYMLSSVLKSKKAIEVNITNIRTFKKLREFTKHYNALAKKIMEVERKSDKQYKELLQALEELIHESKVADSKTIGFIKPK